MKNIKHEEISLEDLQLVGGGCHKKAESHCHNDGSKSGGVNITIRIDGCATKKNASWYGDASLPNIPGVVPGAPDATTTTTTTTTASIPGTTAADVTTNAPASAGLGTALPGA